MNLPRIESENGCVYMLQDIGDSNEYERAKAIDREIVKIFEKNGINVPSTDKSVLKLAFDLLKERGKQIEVIDTLKNYKEIQDLEFVKLTKGKFTVALEQKRYLQCCIQVKEKEI